MWPKFECEVCHRAYRVRLELDLESAFTLMHSVKRTAKLMEPKGKDPVEHKLRIPMLCPQCMLRLLEQQGQDHGFESPVFRAELVPAR